MRVANWIRTLVAIGAVFAGGIAANAFEAKKYDDAAFKAAQSAGTPILVHVTAPWCPTCKAQHQALGEIGKKEAYARIAVFDVDFDTQTDALKVLKANSQSTLIAFKGATETGRLVGATKADALEALIKTTLK
jgi:thiol-disulfide isomerase/thioredoxin